jgi:hypothetical protein
MWPFTTNKQIAPEAPPLWKQNEAMAERFRAWRPIGSEFEYLGRKMVVTGHTRIEAAGFAIFVIPCLKADYADDLGKIHSLEFSGAEVIAMMGPNAEITGRTPAQNEADGA